MRIFVQTILIITVSIFSCYAQPLVTNDGLALTLQSGLTSTIEGAFTNQTNVSLGTIDNAGTITLTGDWTNNSANTVFSTASGSVQFIGGTARSITGSNSTGFYNLTINNTCATGVTLAKLITVANALTLTDGFLYTDAVNILTMNAGSSVGAVSNNSFVYGPMAKIGSTNFTFPVGKDVLYRPIAITSLSGSETFTAQYFHSDPDAVPYDFTSKDATLDHIGRCEYWTLNRAAAINAFVTLSWNSYSCGMDNLTDIRVARWDGAVWRDHGNGGTTGAIDPGTGTVITSAIVTSFSPFTLASSSSNNPLPIELLFFNAVLNNNKVDLIWKTASEINNDYYTVEKSADAINFETIGTVDGSGNSTSTLNYSFVDYNPYNGISYYRLKQTDFDGKFTYSNIKSVNFNKTDNFSFNAYPNPRTGEENLNLSIIGNVGEEVIVVVYDVAGKENYSKILVLQTEDDNVFILDEFAKLAPGVYMISATSNQTIYSKKLIVK